MKTQFKIYTNKMLSLLLTIFVFAFAAEALDKTDVSAPRGISAKVYSTAVENLTQKLKAELVNENVMLSLTAVDQYKISRNQIGLKGEGFCILTEDNNQIPIQFDIRLNSATNTVIDIKYDFPELVNNSENAPPATEEILMQELMKQISRDYKTTNIVVSIDNFEKAAAAENQNEFSGEGEVRIGDFEWKRVNFQIQLNANSNGKVNYQLR